MSQELSEVFYTFLITSSIGLIIGIARLCYKSKCKTVDLCCLKITRDVEIEQETDLELGNNDSKNNI